MIGPGGRWRAVSFAGGLGEPMGVLVAADPEFEHGAGLPLVAVAPAAGGSTVLAAAGEDVSLELAEAGRRWRWTGGATGLTGEVEVVAVDEAPDTDRAEVPDTDPASVAPGPPAPLRETGWQVGCCVSGRLTTGDGQTSVQGTGLLGTALTLPDPDNPLTRSLGVWLTDGSALALSARRPRRSAGHAGEQLAAWVRDGAGSVVQGVAEPLLSTTYDASGRPRRAGLELWMQAEAEFPRRAAGEGWAATSVHAGDLRWDVSFMAWTMEGRRGGGPYLLARLEG